MQREASDYAPLGDDTQSLLHGGNQNYWHAIADLDAFLTRVYNYHYEGGFKPIVASRVLNLVKQLFVMGFTTFFLLFINWEGIKNCTSEETCHDVKPFQTSPLDASPSLSGFVIFLDVMFGLYWVWSCYRLFYNFVDALEIKTFYQEQLHVSEDEIETLPWQEITARLAEVQKRQRLCIVKEELTEIDIAHRIMRKENYLIGMINKDILALQFPGLGPRWMLFPKLLEWNLQFCLMNEMFDGRNFSIRNNFLNDSNSLRSRFKKVAILNLVLAPFAVFFMVIFFFLKYAEEVKSRPGFLGVRSWSPLALWKFREFNELPHVFETRIKQSYTPAENYYSAFPSTFVSVVAQFFSFIFGSFIAILIVVSLYSDSALLYLKLSDRNLVWYITVFSVALAITKGFVSESRSVSTNFADLMKEVYTQTHYMPKHWRHKEHSLDVRAEFGDMLQMKVWIFVVQEMLSPIITPFILYFSLPSSADKIVKFVREFTVHIEGVGDVCSFANFEFDRHGNDKYGASTGQQRDQRSRQGKMEKSFLNFKANNPNWDSKEGESVVAALQGQAATPSPTSDEAHGHRQWPPQFGAQSQLQVSMGLDQSIAGQYMSQLDSFYETRSHRSGGLPGSPLGGAYKPNFRSGMSSTLHSETGPSLLDIQPTIPSPPREQHTTIVPAPPSELPPAAHNIVGDNIVVEGNNPPQNNDGEHEGL